MTVARVFNNNVVLALDARGGEAILTGRGLGYQARPGQAVDPAKVVREFRPTDGRDPDSLGELLAEIPPEHVALVAAALHDTGLDTLATNPALVVALADHVGFAIRRAGMGMVLDYPLAAEVAHLYAEEYARAGALLAAVNARSAVQLPREEVVGLALHLVNAGFATGDLSFTYTMTGVLRQLLEVIEQRFDVTVSTTGVNVGRFLTHLRYLFVRIAQGHQLDDAAHSAVGAAIREAYPDAAATADRLAELLELRLGAVLTADEVSYLTLHVARVVTEPEPPC